MSKRELENANLNLEAAQRTRDEAIAIVNHIRHLVSEVERTSRWFEPGLNEFYRDVSEAVGDWE